MNERMERVLQKMEKKGIDQLLVSDPLSIRFLTGIMVHPGERLYALLLRTNGKHTMFLNYLYYVSDTGFEEVWFSDMDDQVPALSICRHQVCDKAGFLLFLHYQVWKMQKKSCTVRKTYFKK